MSEKWYAILGTFGWSYPLDEYVYSTTVSDHQVIPEVQINGVRYHVEDISKASKFQAHG